MQTSEVRYAQPSGSIAHGAVFVPAENDVDYAGAVAYLRRDPAMAAVVDRVERGSAPVNLTINARGIDSYDPASRILAWDPHSALATSGGGRQSPALGLGHELAHAASGAAAQRLARIPDARYGSAEERRAIAGTERHAAETLGEDVRYDGGGTLYRVASVTDR